jgi:hypothetical protein
MDDELEADVDEDVADDVADFVADTWHILWLPRGRKCGIDDVIFF